MALIQGQLTYDGFDQADLIIEAAFESMELKKRIFVRSIKLPSPIAVLASNTSTLDIDAIASVTSRPRMVIGLYFFSPANVMRLVEIVRGTSDTAKKLSPQRSGSLKQLSKVGVVVGNCWGFRRQSDDVALHARGAVPGGRRRHARTSGPRAHQFRHGYGHLRRRRHGRYRCPAACAQERKASWKRRAYAAPLDAGKSCFIHNVWGKKTGAGWYRYDENRKPIARS